MFRGRGGRFPRMPPSRWSGGGGGRNHPYRCPPDHRPGGGPGSRTSPGEYDRGFHGYSRDFNGGVFVKLFVGAVPRTATEEEVRPLFEEHGEVIEVVFIKDRRTGQQQNCCFVKFAAVEDAERAIGALHKQYTLPGGSGPIQVRYADGERERLGNCNQSAFEHRLFVASINKQATERDIEEIFTPYGRVEDIFLLRDEMKQNQCCFVKLTNKEMADAAINALHGTYVMSGCDQPLIVRFAYPKKPRPGEFRGGHTFGGPGFHPHFQGMPALRRTPNHTEPVDGDMQSNTSRPVSPQCFGPTSENDTTGAPADGSKTLSSSQQVHQFEQLQNPLSVGVTIGSQGVQSQGGQLSDSQSPIQQNAPGDATHIPLRLREQGASAAADEQQLSISSTSQQLLQPPLQQSPSSLTESQWNGRPQSGVSTPFSVPPSAVSSVASIATIPLAMRPAFCILCNWSEHTCPDGFKYYYNCITRESVWEKPKEYADFERKQQHKMQQQQKPLNSPSQTHLHSQIQSTQAFHLHQAQSQVQSIQ